jgi:hypothetical protein
MFYKKMEKVSVFADEVLQTHLLLTWHRMKDKVSLHTPAALPLERTQAPIK